MHPVSAGRVFTIRRRLRLRQGGGAVSVPFTRPPRPSLTPASPPQEKEIYEACIRPPPNRTVYSRELWTGARPPQTPPPCLLDGPVKPSPVIRSPAPASWPLTVVVPRQSRAPTPTPTPPPVTASSAASAQLSQYSNDSGTRLSGVRLVGCLSSWDAPLSSAAARARLQ